MDNVEQHNRKYSRDQIVFWAVLAMFSIALYVGGL
jgi:hypothetical protein